MLTTLAANQQINIGKVHGWALVQFIGPGHLPIPKGPFGLGQHPAQTFAIAGAFGRDIQARHPPPVVDAAPDVYVCRVHHELIKPLSPQQRRQAGGGLHTAELQRGRALWTEDAHIAQDPHRGLPPSTVLRFQTSHFNRHPQSLRGHGLEIPTPAVDSRHNPNMYGGPKQHDHRDHEQRHGRQ